MVYASCTLREKTKLWKHWSVSLQLGMQILHTCILQKFLMTILRQYIANILNSSSVSLLKSHVRWNNAIFITHPIGLLSITRITKKNVTRVAGKTFFLPLFRLNINFYFKCYLHHNCSVNLNWNNTQLYRSEKPLCNVNSSLFWFVNFCFLLFLHRTIIQE